MLYYAHQDNIMIYMIYNNEIGDGKEMNWAPSWRLAPVLFEDSTYTNTTLLTILIVQLGKSLSCSSITGGGPGPPLSSPIFDVIDWKFVLR